MSGAPLTGDLGHFFPAEVLQLLQLAQATGRLELARGGERAEIYVERGRPVFARTTGGSVRTGQALAHRGVVSAELVARALEAQAAQPERRIGSLLVEQGAATREQVDDAIRDSLRRIVYGLLLWRDGHFRFVQGEQASGEDVRLDLDLERLILEGLRQADEARASR